MYQFLLYGFPFKVCAFGVKPKDLTFGLVPSPKDFLLLFSRKNI